MTKPPQPPHQFNMFIREYDQTIDWETRFKRESPFFQRFFQEANVNSVLDCACSSGHHSQLFAQWNKESVGVDKDPEVIDYARRLAHSIGSQAQFQVAKLSELSKTFSRKFGAVTILGNGLAFLSDLKELENTLTDVFNILNSPGVMITQIVNFNVILRKKIIPLRASSTDEGDTLFIRVYERIHANRSNLNAIVIQRQGKQWQQQMFTFPLLNINARQMSQLIRKAGFTYHQHYGSYDFTPFTKDASDLITIAKKM